MAGAITVFPILQTGKLRQECWRCSPKVHPSPAPTPALGMSEALEVVRCSCSVTLEILLILFQPELIQYFSEKKQTFFLVYFTVQ